MKPITIQDLIIDESLFAPARGERCVLSECRAACCQNGAWIDEGHAERIMKHKAKIAALLPEERRDANLWFDEEREDKDFPSGVGLSCVSVEDPNDASRGACVFLLPNYYCALQVVSEEMKLPYPGLKPIDCALYPILRSGGRLMLDSWSPENLTGADCQREVRTPSVIPTSFVIPAEAGIQSSPALDTFENLRPVFEVFADEVRLVLGEDGLVVLRGG